MMATINIRIYHNELWAPYKGLIFSALYAQAIALAPKVQVSFIHVCRSSGQRKGMDIDLGYHQYPFELLFDGMIEATPLWRVCWRLFIEGVHHHDDLVVLPGYHRLEYWCLLLACLLTGKKRVVFVDTTFNDRNRNGRPLSDFLKRIFFRSCCGFLCYGSLGKDYLSYYKVPASKVEVDCQAAVFPPNYSSTAMLEQRVDEFSVHTSTQWLFVGRLVPEKGIDILLHGFALYHLTDTTSCLTIVGGGPLEEHCRELVNALGLMPHVHFTGMLAPEKITEWYSRATALVLPSVSEAWGLVVNEALSCGCPVIASNQCGCVPELVMPGKTGYVFDSGDVHDLCAKLQKLSREFTGDLACVEQYAERCIETANIYTPQNAASHILSRCLQVLDNPVAPFTEAKTLTCESERV